MLEQLEELTAVVVVVSKLLEGLAAVAPKLLEGLTAKIWADVAELLEEQDAVPGLLEELTAVAAVAPKLREELS